MEEIIKKYLLVESDLSKITDELYNAVNSKYHNRIINCKTMEELDDIYTEIKNIVPNSYDV